VAGYGEVHVFIGGSFNDAVTGSDCTASSVRDDI